MISLYSEITANLNSTVTIMLQKLVKLIKCEIIKVLSYKKYNKRLKIMHNTEQALNTTSSNNYRKFHSYLLLSD